MENINFGSNKKMIEYANEVAAFRLPRWEQIPSLGLYMDQVVTVIEKALFSVLGFNREAFITPAMVNNYVKLGMVRKPDKKKYSREHLASLIVITILKQSIAIGDIRLGMDSVLSEDNPEGAYDSFCDYVERAMKIVASGMLAPEDSIEIRYDELVGDAMITMAACSFAAKVFTSKMLSIVREQAAGTESEPAES